MKNNISIEQRKIRQMLDRWYEKPENKDCKPIIHVVINQETYCLTDENDLWEILGVTKI